MNIVNLKKSLNLFTDLKFAIFILALIAFASCLGSIIEQDESKDFYELTYPITRPIYNFIDSNLILTLGLDHIFQTYWFFFLLLILSICLISCTITRQFPIYKNSKEFLFKKQQNSFFSLPFFFRLNNNYYLKEILLLKIQNLGFFLFQKGNLTYGYKGLIGRISPILVHLSLLIILSGSFIGALWNFKVQEIVPKGELFHIQNTIKIGPFTSLPNITLRVNDFWVEYKKNRISQFYSNLSILDSIGNETKNHTISVNNPLKYKNIDFYQSDWNLLGIRLFNLNTNNIYELPLFPLKLGAKSWITWLQVNAENTQNLATKQYFTLLFDQLQNSFFLYDQLGNFLQFSTLGEKISSNFKILEIIPSTGLLIKYDPSIPFIYFGFGLLMLTTCLSYFPYNQIWIFSQLNTLWFGSLTNRGKIQLEIDFENLIRFGEKQLNKSMFRKK